MVSKLLGSAAFWATIAQAVDVREMTEGGMSEPLGWEFTQVDQDKRIRHTCSAAHDRVKSTPDLNLNLLRNSVTSDEKSSYSSDEEENEFLRYNSSIYIHTSAEVEPFF